MRSDGKPSHHATGGFRNPPGSPAHRPGQAEYWRFVWRRVVNGAAAPALPPGHALDESATRAGLAAHDGNDALTWLGHAAFLLRLGGQTVLLDPYLGDYASPLARFGPRRFVPPPLPPEGLPPIDLLVISHNHYDHLCAATLARLPGRERMRAIVPLGLKPFMLRRGFTRVHEVDWHDRIELGRLAVTALPAVHWSRRKPWDRNRTLWASFALEADGIRVYFAGDTGYGPVFRDIGHRYGPFDLALLPIGAYEPRSIMEAHHTTPEEAVRLGLDLGAGVIVAMHWGTVVLTDEPPFEPPARFRAAAAAAGLDEARAWLMRIGETRALRRWPGN